MSINLGILALVFILHQVILNAFLKLSKDTTSLKEALGESDCFFTQQGQGIGETGQYFTDSDAHVCGWVQKHG